MSWVTYSLKLKAYGYLEEFSVTDFVTPEMRTRLLEGVHAAGREVLAIYQRDFAVETKADASPLTEADMASHHALVALLDSVSPEVPILSEESDEIPFETRRAWNRYWLIDPLDGTKEFINKNGEFTLNVALIEDGVPVFGIVHAPVLEATWVGQAGQGAFKLTGNAKTPLRVRALPDPEAEPWKVVGSRRHGAESFEAFCAALPAHERVSLGSSLKLCLVAEGQADLYPRLAPTSEWDTAAAQAVVTAAGGEVLNAHRLEPLRCNQQESVLNPFFIVCGQRDVRWESALKGCLK
jgi:3'(2'), 5'-bisphosphate nucleotidase